MDKHPKGKSNKLPISKPFVRNDFTWLAYVMLAYFAYLQASFGPLMPFLRAELHLSYTIGSLHVSAFALGMVLAGLLGDRLAHRWDDAWFSGVEQWAWRQEPHSSHWDIKPF